ncbi:MAG TPA: hypothetical protein VEH84_18605 [Alphaproteobacteria bacterium]|nr:hypothetical protein [Alphaproteobacteria bacterium]
MNSLEGLLETVIGELRGSQMAEFQLADVCLGVQRLSGEVVSDVGASAIVGVLGLRPDLRPVNESGAAWRFSDAG